DVSPQTLALPAALGGVPHYPKLPPAFLAGIDTVARANPAERVQKWAEAKAAITGVDPDAARVLWGRALIEWVAGDPPTRLAAVPALMPLVTEGMTVRPAELHFLMMLSLHLPPMEKKDILGPLL